MNRIGFLGAGQMASALAKGFIGAGLVTEDRISAFDPEPAAKSGFLRNFPGANFAEDNAAVVKSCDCVFLSVKPQVISAVMSQVKSAVAANSLFVSIAAGVSLDRLCMGLGTERVIRVMPNTPCLLGLGASAYSRGPQVSATDAALVGKLLGAVGKAYELEERLLDAVTGLSGSGPAFVYVIIEALADGGVKAGLSRQVAVQLAAQTVFGSAKMVLEGEHPAVLKDRVASPGGTTIAGLAVMEDRAVRGALIAAVVAAAERSAQLGRGG